MEIFLNVSLNLLNSVTKIFVITVKELEPTTQPPLVWETRMLPQCQQDTYRDRIFKLSQIHVSVIFKFPEFAEFSESSAIFRKNSNMVEKFLFIYSCWSDKTGHSPLETASFILYIWSIYLESWYSRKIRVSFHHTNEFQQILRLLLQKAILVPSERSRNTVLLTSTQAAI